MYGIRTPQPSYNELKKYYDRYKDGARIADLHKEIGVSDTTLRNWFMLTFDDYFDIAEANRYSGKRWSYESKKQMWHEYNKGKSIAVIAGLWGLSSPTVLKYIRQVENTEKHKEFINNDKRGS